MTTKDLWIREITVISPRVLWQRESVCYFTTGGLPSISSSWGQAPWDSRPVFFFQLNTCRYSPYVTSSLTRGWVCSLQLLLALAGAVILRFKSCGTHDHILLSQILDSLNLEGQVPVCIQLSDWVAQLYSQALGSLFVSSYDSQSYGGGIRTRLHTVCALIYSYVQFFNLRV
jgi:hypothetical protein